MPFPSTGVLDNFNRADETPIVTNWTTPMYSDEATGPDNWNNQMDFRAGSAYYDLFEYGPDCEAWITLTTPPPLGEFNLRARIQGEGGVHGSGSYYWARFVFAAGTYDWSIRKRVSGVDTIINAGASTTLVSGDGVGLECIGTTIAAYKRSAGTWSQLGTATDSAITALGFIGVHSDDGGCNADDFGGGAVVEAPSAATLRRIVNPLRWA